MTNLRTVLAGAQQKHVAIGHFNFSELTVLKAVVATAIRLKLPVLVGVSEGERAFIGVREAAALVKSIREDTGHPIFLNADHTHSLKAAEEAARAGFDMMVFDRSEEPLDKNIAETIQAIEATKSINPAFLVEGEIGYIGSSSAVLDKAPEGIALTSPEEAKHFVEATRVDILAPAVGNMHGMLAQMVRGEAHKHLDVPRIAAIKSAAGVFLTLHGGSGTSDEDFVRAIKVGVNVVHINTELRVAWRRGLEESLGAHPTEVAPYKILPDVEKAVAVVVQNRLELFTTGAEATAAAGHS
jgi:fructose-bisphosphate aldolase, class II